MAGQQQTALQAGACAHDIIIIGSEMFVADYSGALWSPTHRLLIAADLHLEKGSAYARRGSFLPPYDSRQTLQRLEHVIARFDPHTVVLLGDSFHDVEGMAQIGAEERALISQMQRKRDWIWITGNHDPQIAGWLGGDVQKTLTLGDVVLRHDPVVDVLPKREHGLVGEIAGHFHPVARIVRHGRSLRRRCFVSVGGRLVMPAFGAYAGGLNVCDEAFSALLACEKQDLRVWMLGDDDVFPIRGRELCGD
ncbi:MAG: ligase-associated DNA damage response endonuclease PdeM [Pseudomonadota bacterium]